MSGGSGASNFGYGNIAPLSNINGQYVNADSSNSPATFGSNEIPGSPPGIISSGLAGAKYNVDAAAGIVPGICLIKGGAKKIKRKIKNITKKYKKMRAGSKKIKSFINRLRSRMSSRSLAKAFSGGKRTRKHRTRKHKKHSRKQLGGYSQYQNNSPITPTYSVGGVLPPSQLGLANPPPITVLPNCTNCVDNYNHYTNSGFPSKGN
jgi:hypothetical protein